MPNRTFKIVVFGCGDWGRSVVSFLGEDNVDFFCDNNPNIIGDSLLGHPVISYKEMLGIWRNENTLIILGLNRYNAEMVAEQLELDGVYDYVFHEFLPRIDGESNIKGSDLNKFAAKNYRYECCIRYMKERLKDKKSEIEYLKKHADIHRMKVAGGKLRNIQLQCVRNAKETLDFLEKNCPVECWITGGTLIGKLRHNGFVPWDNDMDFGIMRKDIRALTIFFKNYSEVIIPEQFHEIDDMARKHNGKFVLLIGPDYLRIMKNRDGNTVIMLEAFPFDYYRDDMTIDEYAKFTSEAFLEKKTARNWKEWNEICHQLMVNSRFVSDNQTSKILPGIDSFIYRGLWNIERFLSYDTIFPLHETTFEGEKFLCVNKPQEYIEYEYPNWEQFPGRIPVGDYED